MKEDVAAYQKMAQRTHGDLQWANTTTGSYPMVAMAASPSTSWTYNSKTLGLGEPHQ